MPIKETNAKEIADYLQICGWVGCTEKTIQREIDKADTDLFTTIYGKSNSGEVAFTFYKDEQGVYIKK